MQSGGSRSRYKRTNMGQVSGDFPVQYKARMLESRLPFYVPYSRTSRQFIGSECIKSFCKQFERKASRRFRHKVIESIES